MAKHARHEREQRAAETLRVKEIEAAWLGSIPAATLQAFTADVAVARARGPVPAPAPMEPGTPPRPPRPGREPRPSKEERLRSRPFKD